MGSLLDRLLEGQADVVVEMLERAWASFAVAGALARRRSDQWCV